MPSLVIISEEHNGKTFELSGTQTVGRHSDCEIIISDGHVSSCHSRIDSVGDEVTIQDLDSSNGTYVNGEEIKSRILQDGDEIVIASTVFRFSDPRSMRSSSPQSQTVIANLAAGESKDVTLYSQPAQSTVRPVQSGKVKISSGDSERISFDANMDASQSLAMGLQGDIVHKGKPLALTKATHRLETLVQLGTHLATTTDIGAISEIIIEKVFETLPQADRGFLMLVDGDDAAEGELTVQAMRNRDVPPGQESVIDVSRTVLREALAHKAVLFSAVEGVGDDVFSAAASIGHLQISSVMCVPMELNGKILGLLYISTKNRRKAFTKDDMGLLSIVATQAAISIENIRMAEQMSRDAEVRNSMARYLSPRLVDQVVSGEMALEMGGVRKIGTILFSDLIGFSKWSLTKRPEDVMSLLNDYLGIMETVIFENDGTIDKTMGDAIMAMWGVLVDASNAPAMAVTAALRMQNRQYVLCNKMRGLGESIPGMGIGVNTGELVAGNMGSEHKVEYTVLGKNVNLAQRLEGLAGFGQVFVSTGTYDAVNGQVIALTLPDVRVKGWDDAVPLYSIRGIQVKGMDSEGKGKISLVTSIPLVAGTPADWPATPPDYTGVIVLADQSKDETTVHAWLWEAADEGQTLQLQPFLQEKDMPPMSGEVQSCQLIQDEALGDYYRVSLKLCQAPDELTQLLRIGECSPADWSDAAQIVRA